MVGASEGITALRSAERRVDKVVGRTVRSACVPPGLPLVGWGVFENH